MIRFVAILQILYCSFLLFVPSPSFAKLQHVQLFFRHGERTPTSFLTFPTEPNSSSRDAALSHLELGELTTTGMWQEYRLGMLLRAVYGKFLGDFYHSKEIAVYSGRDNRTVASAQLVLAGLFPPRGDQVWNRQLLWQPIPVETVRILDHPSFGMFDHCPKEKARVQASPEFAQMERQFAGDIADLKNKTGVDIPNLDIFQKVLDAIVTRAELPKLLPLPEWALQPEYLAHIKRTRLALHEGLIDTFLAGMGGWHLDQIVGRMEDAIARRNEQRAVLYSAHDTNFLTLGRFLGIPGIAHQFPTYASLLAIELHWPNDGEEALVEFKFRNGLDSSSNLTRLEITECPSPCAFSKFRLLRPRVNTGEWMEECEGPNPSASTQRDGQCTLYGPIAGLLLVLVIVLLSAMLSLLWSCRSYKRRYERMVLDEKSPLLNGPNR